MEKKLRIFDLSRISPISAPSINGSTTGSDSDTSTISADKGFEIGPGVHKGTIKSIVWTLDPNILVTAADDKMIRWWDLNTRSVVQEQAVEGEIGSCEFTNVKGEEDDIGGGLPVLTIAAGKTIYFYGGGNARALLKTVVMPYDVASVALHPGQRKYITGGMKDTWAKVYDYDSGKEIGLFTDPQRITNHTNVCRCAQRPPWPDLEHQLLTRWQALCDWKRGRNHQDVEELHWPIRFVACG